VSSRFWAPFLTCAVLWQADVFRNDSAVENDGMWRWEVLTGRFMRGWHMAWEDSAALSKHTQNILTFPSHEWTRIVFHLLFVWCNRNHRTVPCWSQWIVLITTLAHFEPSDATTRQFIFGVSPAFDSPVGLLSRTELNRGACVVFTKVWLGTSRKGTITATGRHGRKSKR